MLSRTIGRKKLCMYGALSYLSYLSDLEEQRLEDTLNSSFGVAMRATKRGTGAVFNRKEVSRHVKLMH